MSHYHNVACGPLGRLCDCKEGEEMSERNARREEPVTNTEKSEELKLTQEDINVLAAEFNLTDEDEYEMFAKALTLCQKFKKERDTLREENADLKHDRDFNAKTYYQMAKDIRDLKLRAQAAEDIAFNNLWSLAPWTEKTRLEIFSLAKTHLKKAIDKRMEELRNDTTNRS
jgi:hypothetical protein